jgi:hypothetical protein
MRQNLHDFMRVGIVHFMVYPQAKSKEHYLSTLASIVEDEFFGAVEITSPPDVETVEQANRSC